MNVFMQAVLSYMSAHWEELTAAATVLGIALVSCMPQNRPKTIDDWYDYIRHSLQTAIPAARAATPAQTHIQTTEQTPGGTKTEDSTYQTNPTPPVTPAQPQK